MLKIKYKKIHPDAIIPKYAHEGDSGLDLYSIEDYELKPLERKLIKTGLKLQIPEGYEAQVRPKSGLAINSGITVLNTPGTVDSCYRGKINIILINLSKEPYKIEKGKKIAQLVFQKVEKAILEEVSSLDETTRNDNGFGSTGLN